MKINRQVFIDSEVRLSGLTNNLALAGDDNCWSIEFSDKYMQPKFSVMSKEEQSFFHNPTKTQLILWTVAWFIGVFLVVLADTDFFTQYPFHQDSSLLGLSVLGATISTIKLYGNYYSSGNRVESNE